MLIRCKNLIIPLVFAAVAFGYEPSSYELMGIEANLEPLDVKVLVVERSASADASAADYLPDISLPIYDMADITASAANGAGSFSAHANAVCSMLAGVGRPFYGAEQVDYLAPLAGARLQIVEYWDFLAANVAAQRFEERPDVITMSLGSTLEDWWTKGAERLVSEYDTVAFASIGNGDDILGFCLYPGASANFIGVGVALEKDFPSLSGELLGTEGSSSFSTDSTVVKPDLVAPGNFLVSGIDGHMYLTGSYSSFASPAAAAAGALLIDEIKTHYTPAKGNISSLVRAILCDSARKGRYWHKGLWSAEDDDTAVYDSRQGAGLVDLAAAQERLRAGRADAVSQDSTGRWDEATISKGAIRYYPLSVNEDERYISATLCWKRTYNATFPYSASAEDSNLRLELFGRASDGGWILLAVSDSAAANTEHIFTSVAQGFADYRVAVLYSDADACSADAAVDYAIAFGARPMPEDWKGWLDTNSDSKLDFNDVALALATGSEPAVADINGDGTGDFNDIMFQLGEIVKTLDKMETE
ncbi:MAG: S8 family serine peptidase [Phycisphaerae bacterium]